MTKQLLSKIEGCYSSMSKGHKRITDYITENYDKAAFMTAAKICSNTRFLPISIR